MSEGRVWAFGDDVDTDVLAPGQYMKSPMDVLASHCLEALDPRFAVEARPGDVVIAGRNFGIGSSREQAAKALLQLGIAAVVARSFGGIFYRNALNLGLPALASDEAQAIPAGHRVSVDARAGLVRDRTLGRDYPCEPIPAFLVGMIEDGGLMPHLQKRFAARRR